MVKIFRDRNSRRISSCINAHTGNVPHDSVFSCDFHANVLLGKLPNTSTRGLLPV